MQRVLIIKTMVVHINWLHGGQQQLLQWCEPTPNFNGFRDDWMLEYWKEPVYQIFSRILAIKGRRDPGSQLKRTS